MLCVSRQANLLCEGEKYSVPGLLNVVTNKKKLTHIRWYLRYTKRYTHTQRSISIRMLKCILDSSLMMKWNNKDKDGNRFQCQTHDLKIVSDRARTRMWLIRQPIQFELVSIFRLLRYIFSGVRYSSTHSLRSWSRNKTQYFHTHTHTHSIFLYYLAIMR